MLILDPHFHGDDKRFNSINDKQSNPLPFTVVPTEVGIQSKPRAES